MMLALFFAAVKNFQMKDLTSLRSGCDGASGMLN